MGRIYAIAVNTFREAVRDRVLYGVLAFATLVLVFALALGELSLNQQERVVSDIGLASISLFSIVIAVFLGSSLLHKELERKTLHVILPKPIARWEFLVGKYVGIAITATVFVATMTAVQLWVMSVQREAPLVFLVLVPVLALLALIGFLLRKVDVSTILLPWSVAFLGASAILAQQAGADVVFTLLSVVLTLAEVLLVAAVALFFSSFSTPFLTGALTLGVWLVGRSADDMIAMRSRSLTPLTRSILHGLGRIVPNFNLFVPGRHALMDGGAAPYVTEAATYGVLYAAVVLIVASFIFGRRDLT